MVLNQQFLTISVYLVSRVAKPELLLSMRTVSNVILNGIYSQTGTDVIRVDLMIERQTTTPQHAMNEPRTENFVPH